MTEKDSPFPSAQQDLEAAESKQDIPQTRSPSYRLAFADTDFMLRDELRGVRLEVELLKADLALDDAGIDSTIVVFGSARGPAPDEEGGGQPGEKHEDYRAARRFARLVAESPPVAGQRFVIATGGGEGIMEAANRGASDAGKPTIGFNIVLKTEQAPNRFITPDLCFQFHYFGLRKMHLLMRARALVCFPGGFGTLDELFETLTLIQTEKVAPMPVLLYRAAWWKQLINFDLLVDQGMISSEDLKIFRFVETADEAWAIIRDFYETRAPTVADEV
ncbi:MAG: LOG family protein [Alphaproteobacteria bacterium]